MLPLTFSTLLLSAASLVSAAPAAPEAPAAPAAAPAAQGASAAQVAPASSRGEDNLARDAATLQAFAKTLTDDPPGLAENWKGNDICHWKGITCAKRHDGVTAVCGIDFNGFALKANLRLQGLLDKLTDLTFFHVNGNFFRGTIPDVSALKTLYEVDLSANNLTGTFPKTILEAPLTILDLRFNELQGPLPEDIFMTTDLDAFWVNNNKFSGPIPETGDIALLYLSLANNQFSGRIPKSIARNRPLLELALLNNQLRGNIPEEICQLKKLTLLDVSYNPKLAGVLAPACQNLLDRGILKIEGTGLKPNKKKKGKKPGTDTGADGAGADTGSQGAGTNTGSKGAGTNTGSKGAEADTGSQGAGTNTGSQGAEKATGS